MLLQIMYQVSEIYSMVFGNWIFFFNIHFSIFYNILYISYIILSKNIYYQNRFYIDRSNIFWYLLYILPLS